MKFYTFTTKDEEVSIINARMATENENLPTKFPNVTIPVSAGEWIVQNDLGNMVAIPDHVFMDMYAPASVESVLYLLNLGKYTQEDMKMILDAFEEFNDEDGEDISIQTDELETELIDLTQVIQSKLDAEKQSNAEIDSLREQCEALSKRVQFLEKLTDDLLSRPPYTLMLDKETTDTQEEIQETTENSDNNWKHEEMSHDPVFHDGIAIVPIVEENTISDKETPAFNLDDELTFYAGVYNDNEDNSTLEFSYYYNASWGENLLKIQYKAWSMDIFERIVKGLEFIFTGKLPCSSVILDEEDREELVAFLEAPDKQLK